jgi:glycerol-3-phosphate dehydrogenase
VPYYGTAFHFAEPCVNITAFRGCPSNGNLCHVAVTCAPLGEAFVGARSTGKIAATRRAKRVEVTVRLSQQRCIDRDRVAQRIRESFALSDIGPARVGNNATHPYRVDLLIIGGGINGAGIARDAAGRGLKVALVEQSDLASATSSAATKLIHGGLRYLELFEFRLVREALMERERLMSIAPHLIRPLEFVCPHVPALRPLWQLRLGLFLYDHLASRTRLPASRALRLAGTQYGAPLRDRFVKGFTYADCWVDDSRLVALNAVDAAERGALVHTRTRFVSALSTREGWHVECKKLSNAERVHFRARAIVNAAGPWVQQCLQSVQDTAGDKRQAKIRLVKGSHIIVPRLYEGDHAYTLQHTDGRVIFTIPYEGDHTVIGTTDLAYEGDPAAVSIEKQEIEYLCAAANAYFLCSIEAKDVRWTYSGVRPLVDDESTNVSKVTRDYRLELGTSKDGLAVLSIFGGKITTYRKLAEAALRRLQPFVGGSTNSWTHGKALPGGNIENGHFDALLSQVRSQFGFLPDSLSLRVARAYGTRVFRWLSAAKQLSDLGTNFGGGLTQAEIEYLVAHEWAVTADDILWRRTKCGLHMNDAQRASVGRYLESRGAVPRVAVSS